MLQLQEMQGGFSFIPPKVIAVNHHLLIYGGARAYAGFALQGVWEGGTGFGGEGESSKEHLGWGIGGTVASCSVTLGIGHGKRQERWGSNVYDVRLCLLHCSQSILFYSKQRRNPEIQLFWFLI